MAFRQEDFKKTSRKGSGDAPASVYPHQLKDKKTVARLEIAIRTFDGAVGKRRKDMDAQAMTDFFGDPRLARGIVACLGQFYRYETLDFAQAVVVGHGHLAADLFTVVRSRIYELAQPVQVRVVVHMDPARQQRDQHFDHGCGHGIARVAQALGALPKQSVIDNNVGGASEGLCVPGRLVRGQRPMAQGSADELLGMAERDRGTFCHQGLAGGVGECRQVDHHGSPGSR